MPFFNQYDFWSNVKLDKILLYPAFLEHQVSHFSLMQDEWVTSLSPLFFSWLSFLLGSVWDIYPRKIKIGFPWRLGSSAWCQFHTVYAVHMHRSPGTASNHYVWSPLAHCYYNIYKMIKTKVYGLPWHGPSHMFFPLVL